MSANEEVTNFEILSRAAIGDPYAEKQAVRILLAANRNFFRNGFAVNLERCCGIPSAPARLLRSRRDYWLRIACAHCTGESQWQRSINLAYEIGIFKSVIWPRWSDQSEPPIGASQLREALFNAAQIGRQIKPSQPLDAIPNTARMIYNIVKYS